MECPFGKTNSVGIKKSGFLQERGPKKYSTVLPRSLCCVSRPSVPMAAGELSKSEDRMTTWVGAHSQCPSPRGLLEEADFPCNQIPHPNATPGT